MHDLDSFLLWKYIRTFHIPVQVKVQQWFVDFFRVDFFSGIRIRRWCIDQFLSDQIHVVHYYKHLSSITLRCLASRNRSRIRFVPSVLVLIASLIGVLNKTVAAQWKTKLTLLFNSSSSASLSPNLSIAISPFKYRSLLRVSGPATLIRSKI